MFGLQAEQVGGRFREWADGERKSQASGDSAAGVGKALLSRNKIKILLWQLSRCGWFWPWNKLWILQEILIRHNKYVFPRKKFLKCENLLLLSVLYYCKWNVFGCWSATDISTSPLSLIKCMFHSLFYRTSFNHYFNWGIPCSLGWFTAGYIWGLYDQELYVKIISWRFLRFQFK